MGLPQARVSHKARMLSGNWSMSSHFLKRLHTGLGSKC